MFIYIIKRYVHGFNYHRLFSNPIYRKRSKTRQEFLIEFDEPGQSLGHLWVPSLGTHATQECEGEQGEGAGGGRRGMFVFRSAFVR